MKPTHTPGPWKVFEHVHQYRDGGGEFIERLIGTTWDHGQLKGPCPVVTKSYNDAEGGSNVTVEISKEDAALIAAAPALLKALQKLVSNFDDDFNVQNYLSHEAIDEARKAIAATQ